MKNFTYSIRVSFLCILLAAGIFPAMAQQVEKNLVLSTKERVGFLQYTPAEYASEGNVKHPLIIFLHGIGERGNGTTDLKNVARIGLPKLIKDGNPMKFTWNGKTETFLVVSPQCPSSYGMWPQKMVAEIIAYAKQNLRVDTNRIYLTGLSMGGGGSLRYISGAELAPKTITAVSTICTPCTFDNGEYVAKAKLPLWSFHAADDAVALSSCTDRAINRINAFNPQVKPIRTIWPTGGHAVWDRVYADLNYKYNHVLNIYEWFLGQNKSMAPNKMPVANAGADMRVSPLQKTIVLNGSASKDADGRLVRYVWRKIAGPAAGAITAPMSANASTTVSGLNIAGEYLYELAAVDDRAGYTFDTVKITVAANAALPVPDSVKPAHAAKPDTVKPTPASKPDVIQSAPKPAGPANKPPVAKTTPDQVVPLEWNYSPAVSAWPSTDTDGWINLFTWEKISGPNTYTIANPRSCRTVLSNLKEGVYVFRVTAYDNKGATSYADVKVTMTKKPMQVIAQASTLEAPIPVTKLTMNKEQLLASPNPAVGLVNIQYSSESTGASVMSVYDVNGRLVKNISFYKKETAYQHNLDISQLNSGLYYVQVRTANALQLQTKIVKR